MAALNLHAAADARDSAEHVIDAAVAAGHPAELAAHAHGDCDQLAGEAEAPATSHHHYAEGHSATITNLACDEALTAASAADRSLVPDHLRPGLSPPGLYDPPKQDRRQFA